MLGERDPAFPIIEHSFGNAIIAAELFLLSSSPRDESVRTGGLS